MKRLRRIDLAGSDFIKDLTPEDMVGVPEFLTAYSSQNGAALHAVIPEPKYKKGDEQKNPEKYKLQREQYRQALPLHSGQPGFLTRARCRTPGSKSVSALDAASKGTAAPCRTAGPASRANALFGGHSPDQSQRSCGL